MAAKKRILIVDDNEHWLETINMILQPIYEIERFIDPVEALESVKHTAYSLVILDKNLAGISGLDVLKDMRIISPELRAIILTEYADIESAVKSMKMGALDYVSKGTENLTATLRAKVEEALTSNVPTVSSKPNVSELLAMSESDTLEFKSSARWDFRNNKLSKDTERAIVKTVAAFLNSSRPSHLLIGVDDNRTVLGLRYDYKTLGKRQDRDGYENFLTSLLLDILGKDCSPFFDIRFHTVGESEICQISTQPASKPVFVRDEKGEHFYIRVGNSTRLLSSREAIEYYKIRWKGLS